MRVPYIHINGTSPESLRKQYLDAWEAVDHAIAAVSAIETHDRDYYPISNEAGPEAREEKRARLVKLETIKSEL